MSAVAERRPARGKKADEEMLRQLADPWWRLTHLYWIVDENAKAIQFKPNEEQESLFRGLGRMNLILKARQLGFCCVDTTRVLTADLRWVEIRDLAVGDEIVACDEMQNETSGASRKMRTAVVHGMASMRAQAYRITFDDGRSVVCTENHPWLSRKAGTVSSWRSISGEGNQVVGRIKVGTKVRWICKPWDDGDIEDGWFGGMADGEGSLSNGSRTGVSLCVSQLPGVVWDRMARYALGRGYLPRIEDDATERLTKYGKQPVPKLVFSRMDEVFRLIGQTRPSRFISRRWWEGKDLPGKKSGIGWSTVVAIEPVGEQTVVDLQTSTGTYIAEGFVSHNTTLLTIMALDQCLFVPNFTAAIIFHNLLDAEKAFRSKIRFAYDKLPEEVRAQIPVKKETSTELVFTNGSSIGVGVSARSGTVQWLHVSEFGKICAHYPEKAREIVTGSFNAMPADALTFVESTAEGQEGYFYDYCMDALKRQQEGVKPPKGAWKLHFYPWFKKAAYANDDPAVVIDAESEKYFADLERDRGIALSDSQKRWYVTKASQQGEDMKREFPSYPEEAFEQAIKGAIYAKQMAYLRTNNRITNVPWEPGLPVNTFWDFGLSVGNSTAVWFHQRLYQENRFIRFYQKTDEGLDHFVKVMNGLPYVWGTHYVPHDADLRMQGEQPETRKQILERLGMRNIVVVQRTHDVTVAIETTRQQMATCWFDKTECADGIRMLDSYRWKWDEKRGAYSRDPLHNHASNGADAFRQFGQSHMAIANPVTGGKFRRHRWSWRA